MVFTRARQPRAGRPAGACPYCPGGLDAPQPYQVRWVPSRVPPLAKDRCEILLFGPDHGVAVWQLGVSGVRRVIDLWADRTAALGSRDGVAYVLLFENRGPEAGAAVDHPHGQAYAFSEVPQAPLRELTLGRCALCDGPPDRLVVSQAGPWKAWCPEASAWSYELRVAPTGHVQSLPALDHEQRTELAVVLVDALARLDQLFEAPLPYMLWWHQRPTDDGEWPLAHVHAHVAPLVSGAGKPRFVAAGEVGSGVFFNPVLPEDAATKLRALPGAGAGAASRNGDDPA